MEHQATTTADAEQYNSEGSRGDRVNMVQVLDIAADILTERARELEHVPGSTSQGILRMADQIRAESVARDTINRRWESKSDDLRIVSQIERAGGIETGQNLQLWPASSLSKAGERCQRIRFWWVVHNKRYIRLWLEEVAILYDGVWHTVTSEWAVGHGPHPHSLEHILDS